MSSNGHNGNGNKGRKYRCYSDEEKAATLAALEANKGDISKTSRDMKIPRDTLYSWAKGNHIQHSTGEIQQQKKKDLADLLEDVAYRLVDIPEEIVEKANLQQRTVSLGIAIDKMRLLRDQPTAIVDDRRVKVLKSAEDLAAKYGITPDVALALMVDENPAIAEWVN